MAQAFHTRLESILSDERRLQAVSDKAFDKHDVDGSGYIELDEFKKEIMNLYSKIGKPQPSKREIEQILGDLDANGDHRLDREEYKEHTRALLQAMLNGTLGL